MTNFHRGEATDVQPAKRSYVRERPRTPSAQRFCWCASATRDAHSTSTSASPPPMPTYSSM
ncbi:MAG: hypothetical protein ACK56I_28535 [bacterium]